MPGVYQLLLTLCFMFTAIFSNGQELIHWKIGQNEGLPSNTIYFIFQDNDGYFWITTEEGLFKYNGKEFIEIPSKGLKGKSMGQLIQDSGGRIWAKTFNGEVLYIKNDTIHVLDAWNKLANPGFPEIALKGDSLIIVSRQDAYFYNEKKDTVQPFLPKKFNGFDHIWALDAQDQIKLITTKDSDLIFIQEKNGNWTEKTFRRKERTEGNHQIIKWKGKYYLYQSFNFTITSLDNNQKEENLFPGELNKNQKWLSFHNIGDTLFALNSFNGTYLCKDGKVIHHLLPGTAVSAFTIDKEGNIWIGTLRKGIFIFPSLNAYRYSSLSKEDSKSIDSYRICKAGNELRVGTFDGKILKIDNLGNHSTLFDTKQNAEVQSIYYDSITKHVLFFCKNFFEIDQKGLVIKKGMDIPPVKQMIRVKDHYFLATSFGVIKISCADLTTKKSLFPGYRISSIGYDTKRERLFIGSQLGLLEGPIEGDEKDFSEIKSPNEGLSIGATKIISCTSGKIFISTTGHGLLKVEDGKILSAWQPKKEKKIDHIRSLSFYKNGIIFCSNNMFFHLDTTLGKVYQIDETKGLYKSELYDITSIDEKIYIATSAGIQRFDQLPGPNTISPKVVIERIQSNEKYITQDSHYLFSPHENRLEFHFSALPNISSRGKLKIKYRLKGLEEAWNETDMNSPFALYPSIPAGSYSFEIKAINEDGVESKLIESFNFKIKAPFYQRWWFYLILSVLIGATVALVFLIRIRQIRKKNLKEMERQRLFHQVRISQLTSIRSQMNPHFIFNTMSTIQSKVMDGNKEGAYKQIGEFSKLMRKILDISASETMSVKDEYDLIRNYLDLEKERLGPDFIYSVSIDPEIDAEFIRIPSLITQPFIENALRHGLLHKQGEKKLEIIFETAENDLVIKIRDNGIGRKRSEEINKIRNKDHKSFATEAYRRRIDLLNKMRKIDIRVEINDLINQNKEATGTEIVIIIPEE